MGPVTATPIFIAPSAPGASETPCADLYLDLLKRCVTDWIGLDRPLNNVCLWDPIRERRGWKSGFFQRIASFLHRRQIELVKDYNPARDLETRRGLREEGRDWPGGAETMVGLKRLDNLQECIETVLRDGIPGDLIETGVFRGGATIFMRAVLQAHGVTDRVVWVADSFEGLPALAEDAHPLDRSNPHDKIDFLKIPLEEVQKNFAKYGLLDDQVRFLKGWFCDTLPGAPIERLAILRLDGDMYLSTMDALHALYDKLAPGGFCIIDDYGAVPACAQAVEDFRRERGIVERLEVIDWTGIYWRKTR